ncbi:cell wall hydrolase, partial [Lactonifactor longoviformis]
KKNVEWFDKDLKKLFKYGVHDFYTYPDDETE